MIGSGLCVPRFRAWYGVAFLVVLAAFLLAADPQPAARGVSPPPGVSERSVKEVEILHLSGPLDPPLIGAAQQLVSEANRRGSALVVLQLTSPGGIAADVETLLDDIRRSAVPVVVWVGPDGARAAGAAGVLTLGAHLPVMSRQARLGPVCPLNVGQTCTAAQQQTIRRVVAGRQPADLAEAVYRAPAAERAGLVDLVVDGQLPDLLVELDGRPVVTAAGSTTIDIPRARLAPRLHSLGLLSRTLHSILDPTLVEVLLFAVLLLVAFEVFQPGFGVAGVAGVALAPLVGYGLVVLPAVWWALALVVVGMVLLGLDLAIAGLGVPTLAGAAALTVGAWQLFPGGHPVLRVAPWAVGMLVVASVVFFVVVMTLVLRAQAGPDVAAAGQELVGRLGTVRSTLNPEGHVFVSGALWRARWSDEHRGRVATGTRVRVIGLDETTLLVGEPERPTDDQPGDDRGS